MGIHARFRFWCLTACRFESDYPDHYVTETTMKLLTIPLLCTALLGCDNIAPPTNAQVASVAALCEKKGKEVKIYYTGTTVEVYCKEP